MSQECLVDLIIEIGRRKSELSAVELAMLLFYVLTLNAESALPTPKLTPTTSCGLAEDENEKQN